MPVLSKKEIFKDLTLPSFGEEDPAIVTIRNNVTIEDALDIRDNNVDIFDAESGEALSEGKRDILYALVLVIVKWNFTDEDGNELPINLENVSMLPFKDAQYVIREANMERLMNSLDDKKKEDSLPTSQKKKENKKVKK